MAAGGWGWGGSRSGGSGKGKTRLQVLAELPLGEKARKPAGKRKSLVENGAAHGPPCLDQLSPGR